VLLKPACTIACICTLVLAGSAPAEQDRQAWFEAGIRKELLPGLRGGLSGHMRLDNDLTRVKSLIPEIEANYRLLRHLRLATGYRLFFERDGRGNLESGHRIFSTAGPTYPLPRFASNTAFAFRMNGIETSTANSGTDQRCATAWG